MKQINLILPAQAAKMGGDLGAILGQHGVNIVKFCKDFNEISVNYEYNLKVRTILTLEDNSNFNIEIKGPVTTFMIKSLSNGQNQINFLDLYKIIKIKKQINQNLQENILLKNVLAIIKSMRYTIKYE